MKQKTGTTQTQAQFTEPVAVTSAGNENSAFANLSASLAEIRKLKGVMGFILRSNTSAIIDLNEQDKITEYAVLSSQMREYALEMTNQFRLGDTESLVVEGKTVKILCMDLGENSIDVFMTKPTAHARIIKRILL
jgi:predicted regulator of Ras-like GTPase activity (Roadblock/LC7/MglB family)